ncbi:helix-turn-helix domain-containing protein [Neobacillus mesonae]|uniref:helix-turn-helix domain-containing protein n=1 Tax=Neobacillus mesonae TaxID=1193713 RepID=UPI000829954C|nr:helix-turn-helix transcriptional regulator [Neobacillus mesonae]
MMNNLQSQNWVKKQNKKWKKEGSELRQKRKALNVKVKDIASLLGVSESRIYSLETGKPIRDAILFRNAYELALEKLTFRKGLVFEGTAVSGEDDGLSFKVLKKKLQNWMQN